MTVHHRDCIGHADFPAISHFLFSLYLPNNCDGNWLQPIWEYAYTHPYFDEDSVQRIGIWEDSGSMVAVVMYESALGEAFFQVHPSHAHLKPEMLAHAEVHLAATSDEGTRHLRVYVNDFDREFKQLVQSRGYQQDAPWNRPMSQLVIPDPFPPIRIPNGFQLKSLADDNDLYKANRALWRGFNHPGEPPADGIEGRKKMQSGPHFRHDLTMVVEAPNGDLVAFGGLWFDAVNQIGYVEPVATDPDYRRLGLGTATVMEGIRRCGQLGATVAYVGSVQPLYLSMGFRRLYTSQCWLKALPANL